MKPEIFTLGDALHLPSYLILLATGFLLATIQGALWARRIGEDPDIIIDLGMLMLFTGLIGGRVLHVFADGYFWDYVHMCTDPSKVFWKITQTECSQVHGIWNAAQNACQPTESNCFAWAKVSGGLTYYGGFLAALVVGPWFLKRDKFPVWKAADLAGFGTALGLCFGRMGCFLAGCCFGKQADAPLGLVFPPRSPASEWQYKHQLLADTRLPSLPVHATQVYESAISLGIAAVLLMVINPRKRYDGQVFLSFIALYALARFILEFWRSDDRGGMMWLSTSQLIGLLLIAGAGAAHFLRVRRGLALVPKTG
jgi:phosphatidylglycerol---prolipoprotein diacylglyceryl transferase